MSQKPLSYGISPQSRKITTCLLVQGIYCGTLPCKRFIWDRLDGNWVASIQTIPHVFSFHIFARYIQLKVCYQVCQADLMVDKRSDTRHQQLRTIWGVRKTNKLKQFVHPSSPIPHRKRFVAVEYWQSSWSLERVKAINMWLSLLHT